MRPSPIRLFAEVNGRAPAPIVAAEADTAGEGGGHPWPDGPPVGWRVGRVSRDLDASRRMLDFFNWHPQP